MKLFGLFADDKTVINKIKTVSMEKAVEFFSQVKNLPKSSLLDIFFVKEIDYA